MYAICKMTAVFSFPTAISDLDLMFLHFSISLQFKFNIATLSWYVNCLVLCVVLWFH